METQNNEQNVQAERNDPINPQYFVIGIVCYTQYQRLLRMHDDIFQKVSILIAFMSALLIVVVNDMHWKKMLEAWDFSSSQAILHTCVYQICSITSLVGMLIATFITLRLSTSNRDKELDSSKFTTEAVLRMNPNALARKMILDLEQVVVSLKAMLESKQKSYNRAVAILTVSTVLYVAKVIIEHI